MHKEWLLLLLSTLVTFFFVFLLIRWYAPQLLGIPVDLQMVRVAERVAPFFDGVFRAEDYQPGKFILKDPYMMRARPLYPDAETRGPNDLLGFRNRRIPNVADIIAIGDSQTYGNNAVLEDNWPNQMVANLSDKNPSLYSMAVGGWGAAEYFGIFSNSLRFQPRLILVAFYTGNDPRESFSRVYRNPRWAALRLDPDLVKMPVPKVTFPAPQSEWWEVTFHDGVHTIFTPTLRHASNYDHPVVQAGYALMAEVAHRMSTTAAAVGTKIIFTIIPTKELVYAEKVKQEGQEGVAPPQDYADLVRDERRNLLQLADQLHQLSDAVYVDVLSPLQQAALHPTPLYPSGINGHPTQIGYRVIARALARVANTLLPDKPRGGIKVSYDRDQKKQLALERDVFFQKDFPRLQRILLVRNNQIWRFRSLEVLTQNGWTLEALQPAHPRDIANLPYAGIIDSVDVKRFGPRPSFPADLILR